MEQNIVIISPFYNAEKYIEQCILSVANQDYQNYIHVLIDDCSTDNSFNIAKSCIKSLPISVRNNFTLIQNKENVGAVCNQIRVIRNYYTDCIQTYPNNIIMLLDGDDSLVNDPNIFIRYNEIYDDVEFTYGSSWSMADKIPLISQPYPPEIKNTKSYRQYKFNWNMPYTHLRTFRRYLVDKVSDDVFKDENGNWFRAGGDNATFYNILEQADPLKIKVISDIVYNYNDINPLNDYKVNQEEQTKTANYVINEISKYSIVIPTMWRYDKFTHFLKKLVESDRVEEIIIINNDPENTPIDEVLENSKILLEEFNGENIFVNPAWNHGVLASKNEKVCIVNDDVEFDLKLFNKIDPLYDKDFGVIGLCPGESDFNQHPITDGNIDIIPWNGEHTYGFGCLMFVKKSNWKPIPTGLKIYYGDNFIFDNALSEGKINYIITNLKFTTPFAKTTSDTNITKGMLEIEQQIYMNIKNQFNATEYNLLEKEYLKAVSTPSDINHHLPKLKELASECSSVVEFGVRTGVSTRAFLSCNSKLRSYDIQFDKSVQELFNIAKIEGKDVKYSIGDTLKIEIEETDLLFIDTNHTFEQLSQELERHHGKVKKYIAFHDTFSYATPLLTAIINFIQKYPEWKIKYHTTENNGLTVIEKSNNQKYTPKKNILIAIPTAKYIESDTFKSIYDLIIPEGYSVTYQHFYGYNIDQVRNLIADWTIKGFDYLFSVDSDMILPRDCLVKLLSHNKDVVSGLYIQRMFNQHNLELYDRNGRISYEDISGKGLVEIYGCGFGCVLVKKEVFIGVGYPQFEYHSAIDHAYTISEDTDFCAKAVSKGFKIWADTSVKCGHIGNTIFEVQEEINKRYNLEDNVTSRLRELGNQRLLPTQHLQYLENMKNVMSINPNVIYDIGACVLHWTNEAKNVWKDANFVVFEAMEETEFLYKEQGLLHHNGVLGSSDGEIVSFFKNVTHPGGNSYYRENIEVNEQALEYFPDSSKEDRCIMSLDTIVSEMGFPYPDLIKMDVQGAELDILKGATNVISRCSNLILELQSVEYNKGAPLKEEVIEYLNTIGFKLVGNGPFHNAGPDGDYHFMRY